jgi:hypothetical protein
LSAGHRLRIRNAIAELNPVVPLAKNENVAGAASGDATRRVSMFRRTVDLFTADENAVLAVSDGN